MHVTFQIPHHPAFLSSGGKKPLFAPPPLLFCSFSFFSFIVFFFFFSPNATLSHLCPILIPPRCSLTAMNGRFPEIESTQSSFSTLVINSNKFDTRLLRCHFSFHGIKRFGKTNNKEKWGKELAVWMWSYTVALRLVFSSAFRVGWAELIAMCL